MDNTEYINSCKKNKGVSIIVFCLVAVLLVVAVTFIFSNMLQPTIKVQLGDGYFRAKVFKESDKTVSLAKYEDKSDKPDKAVLGANANIVAISEAVLVVFPMVSRWGVSVGDMKDSVDVVWLNEEKKVSYIVKNISPDSFSTEKIEPMVDSAYVIKLAAGVVDKKAIKIGSQASFSLNEGE